MNKTHGEVQGFIISERYIRLFLYLVKSTFDVTDVELLVNGESIGKNIKLPYQWDAQSNAIFKNMNTGNYTIKTTATDNIGNKAEKKICVGGGSQNRLWNQLRADVCNVPIELID